MIGLLVGEIHHQSRLLWRAPIAAFFTLVFPLMFMVLFNLLNSGATLESLGGIDFAQFFTPAIAVFAMVTAAYTNLVITTSMARDAGILKWVRLTPIPPAVHIGGRIGAAMWVGLSSVALMFAVGVVAFGVVIPWDRLPAVAAMMLLGAACFCALGVGMAGLAPNGRSAPAIANATILPLAFVSGIFFPLDTAPDWLRTVASVFPLEPFVSGVVAAFNPTAAFTMPWGDLAVVAIWGMVGLALAVRFFDFEPRSA